MAKPITNSRYLLDTAPSCGVKMTVVDENLPLVEVEKGGKSKLIVKGQLPLNSSQSVKIVREKDLTKKIISRKGVKVPKGVLIKTWEELIKKVGNKDLKFPLVVKPNTEALGKGVVANITNSEELKEAFLEIAGCYGEVLVEECFVGDDHRFLVLDGEVIAVAKRLRPFIVGNGVDTVEKLVTTLNETRVKKIPFDKELDRNLEKVKMNLRTIIPAGVKVNLRANSNFHTGAIVVDATEKAADEYKDIALKAAKAVDIRFAGVDILTKDITVFADYVVTEINSVPGLDVHLDPSEGKSRTEILAKIWGAIFK